MWISGQWTGSVSKKTFPIDNSATEEIIDEVPRANAKDADLAVQSAAEAFRDWRGVPGIERAALMHEFATRLRAKAGAVARRLTLEGGKPLIENLDEVEWCAACFDYYGELARDQGGKVPSPVFRHQINFDPLTDNDAEPFGGMRKSGIGRELGIEGLDAFREPKHVHMDYRIEAKPYWYPYRWNAAKKDE